jgi:glycolate oxidase iron-sulfur subunit
LQTSFTPAQLADPHTAESEKILRACVHCGFCTATCPTYVTLGNELDSPRGRIYLIKDMLEAGRPADKETVLHIDRCLSCLACMTTCPSGVHYGHLVDHARAHIEKTYRRPLPDRLLREALARILPYPKRFRAALKLAKLGRSLGGLFGRAEALRPLEAMLKLAPQRLPARPSQAVAAPAAPKAKVAILRGCAQSVLDPGINDAAERLLARLGVAVLPAPGEGCCGALNHHMGREDEALAFARNNVDAWTGLIDSEGIEAILVTTSGCGTVVKDYGHMLRLDAAYAEKANRVSTLAKDVSEYLVTLGLPEPSHPQGLTVAYHAACSLQHGQRVHGAPKELLKRAGFTVKEPKESHLCCGSAGTYNILHPDIATRLRDRKVKNVEATAPDLVAAGNIGCITQIASGTRLPVAHTVELLDWAYGGPKPAALAGLKLEQTQRAAPAEAASA